MPREIDPLRWRLTPSNGEKPDPLVLSAASTFGKNVMPRAAALLDVQQVSDITGVVSAETFRRPIYAGNAFATTTLKDSPKLVTVRSTAFEAEAAEGGSAGVEEIAAPADQGMVSYVGRELTQSDRPDLTTAKIVISGGRGMASGENFHLLEQVAALASEFSNSNGNIAFG